jgi:hypothetical protein
MLVIRDSLLGVRVTLPADRLTEINSLQAGSLLGNILDFGTNNKLGPTPVADMPFDAIPRMQGPFRSGQDNQEPINDNSRVKSSISFYNCSP